MQKIGILNSSNNVTITNSHFAVNQGADPNATFRFLYESQAKYAGGGHQDPSTCLEGTRTTALEEIDKWKRKTFQEENPKMIWVTGSAGSGKTAIAQTVYESFKAEGLLIVQTSFFRSTGCTDPRYLSLSIAYQLAVANSLLRESIEAVVQADLSVVDAPFDMQLRRLVLEPISEATTQLPMVYIIIDGLDECGVEDQQIQIIQLIQAIVTEQHLPIRFLIASRPESWIRTTLSSPTAPSLSTVVLDCNKEVDNDIQLYYETEFKKIRNDPRHNHSITSTHSSWPSTDDMKQLVRWSSGQFIYAKTVTRFVGEPGHSPFCRLEEIVLRPNSELTKSQSSFKLDPLDALYSQILSCAVDWNLTSNVLGALQIMLLESRIMMRELLSIMEVILGLKSGGTYLALRNLHALVFVPPSLASEREGITNDEYRAKLFDQSKHIRFYHKSFTDFLHHPQRAGKYYIDETKMRQMMAIGCLEVLRGVKMNPPTRLYSMAWLYAHRNWNFHCTESGLQGNHEFLCKLDQFSFTSWYFRSPKFNCQQWKRLTPFRQLEKWSDTLEEIQNIHNTLEAVGLGRLFTQYYPASHTWDWFKAQSDTGLQDFPKLRLKLWILHKLADEDGAI
ncbi:hypothetical protein CPB83DRAFT_883510 [Crepidotus variabilis]|uniref:NACHT domain-containing protein n=1 Tax=Crepidotus variabilis TaxID=179855 RepID=A0A9P6EG86_9AGAR|nr:hypothetical protein CPB83DRAFT_883510 [Crepidotus variabilis]